jgi:murein DD-endopeptidase MepM/ murein hydrolase activator NlpD
MAFYASFKQLAGVGGDSTMQGLSQGQLDSIRNRFESNATPSVASNPEVSYSQGNPPATPAVQMEPAAPDPEPTMPRPSAVPAVKASLRSVLDHLFSPLDGTLNNPFNPDKRHYGVDIVADENAMIHAATDGTVFISEYSEDNGWVIGVSGPDDVMTFYKHNSRLLKGAGTYVRSGEPIAVIGNTGENTSGTHLHFELWQHGRALNPEDHLNFH